MISTQQLILSIIEDEIERTGMAPSQREIGEMIGRYPSTVNHCIKELVEIGILEKQAHTGNKKRHGKRGRNIVLPRTNMASGRTINLA